MTEQELHEKLTDILQMKLQELPLQPHGIIYREAAEYLASALSSAGIGYVSEWKHRAEVAEKDNIKYGRTLYNLAVKYVSAANIWTITADDGKKYLAEKEICALYVINDEIKNAEKELQEERKDEQR